MWQTDLINTKYGIKFTSDDVAKETLNLSKFICSVCIIEDKENVMNATDYKSFKKLNEHLKLEHNNKTICMICADHHFSFPSELKIYTTNQLKNHNNKGSETDGFKGHPMCKFCSNKRFYSQDELMSHMREKHERCHICDKIDHNNPQFFKNYDQLFHHFKNSHYICTFQTCLDDKFIVFKDDMELQAHILQEHGDLIRGKPKFFQSELSTFISTPSRVITDDNAFTSQHSFSDSSLPSLNSVNSTNANNSSQEVKQLRLDERAKHYLDNSHEDFQTFINLNKQYAANKLTAAQLLNSYKNLFQTPQSDVHLLIHNLSELYPMNSLKYKELDSIYRAQEKKLSKKPQLPSLYNDPSSSSSMVNAVWGNSNNNRNVSSLRTNTNRPLNLPSLTSTPSNLNGTRPLHVSHSTSSLTSKSRNDNASSNSRISNLPSLPTPKPKVYIPPVRQTVIPDPNSWGRRGPQQTNGDVLEGISNLNMNGNSSSQTTRGSGKRKQKQLLFHIGI